MIEFRKKSQEKDLILDVIKDLDAEGFSYNRIAPKDADKVSKVNSKALVLVSCKQTDMGYFQIQVQDKELYNYTQKLLGNIFRLRILNVDRKTRVITAECDHFGKLLDMIEILAGKYDLSIVVDDD